MANLITIFRVLLALFSISMMGTQTFLCHLIGVLLIPIVMLLDILDGVVARRVGPANPYGSLYDIVGDRIVSFAYFVFFVSVGVCPYWPAVVIIIRGLILDLIRSMAFERGITAFGDNVLSINSFALWLTKSTFSRATYNGLKTLVFILMGMQVMYGLIPVTYIEVLVWVTVGWSLVRAIPVLLMGYKLAKK